LPRIAATSILPETIRGESAGCETMSRPTRRSQPPRLSERQLKAPAPAGNRRPVSYRTVLRHPKVQVLATSRAAQKLGGATLSYGAMVYLARGGASQLDISLVSASSYIAALLFGFQNGIIVDTLTKRTAIVAGFTLQAALCVLIPFFRGTETGDLMLLIFLSTALSQLISPGLKSAVALIATRDEMAPTASLVSVIGSVASAIGSTLVAPTLMRYSSLDVLLGIVAGLFLFSGIRAISLPGEHRRPIGEGVHQILSMPSVARRVMRSRTMTTMLLLGAIMTALYEATTTMLPIYASEVLGVDPANTVYVFAPAAIGFMFGIVTVPWLIQWLGERRVIITAIFVSSTGIIGLGLIDVVAPLLAPVSPLRLAAPLGIDLSDEVLAAGVLAVPANFGSSMASMAVQVFINRTVRVANQGTVFGLQDMQKNALNIVAVLAVGLFALLVPLEYIFIALPILVIFLLLQIVIVVARSQAHVRLTTREAWNLLIGHQPARPR
jgi:MFS family permease